MYQWLERNPRSYIWVRRSRLHICVRIYPPEFIAVIGHQYSLTTTVPNVLEGRINKQKLTCDIGTRNLDAKTSVSRKITPR